MDGKIFDSEIYDRSGKRSYNLRGLKIYKPTGELIGQVNAAQ